MLRETRYDLPYGQIAATEAGTVETAEISVVFLHGWLDNSASFHSMMHRLHTMAPSLHLCAPDFPGHGLSDHKPEGFYYPFHDYIDDIYQLLLKLSPNKLLLVGHSLGALVASCYSAAFPEQVAGLVQIEGVGPLAESADLAVDRLRRGVVSRERIRRKPERGYRTLIEAIQRRAQANQIEPDLIAPIVERGIIRSDGIWQWRHDVKLKSDSLYRMSFEHAQAIMEQVVCPQRIVLGENGFKHLKQPTERNSSLNRDRETLTIPGGHHCHLECPDRVTELIFGLVNKI